MGAAIFRKLFMSSASSALGTGAAIGISNAVAPAAPSIQGSNITSADVDDSKNLMKFDFYGGTSFFIIMLMILIYLVVIVVMPVYCCVVLPIQTTPKEEWKKMEVGTCTDDRTVQQAWCTGVATRSIGWKGTYWDLIAKTHMRCITYILLHYIWKINVNIQDVYHRALLPFQSNTWKKKNDIEIHSFSKIIFLTIFFHSKNIKRISINE